MPESASKAVLLTGGSGLIGSALTRSLSAGHFQVIKMVRKAPTGPAEVGWNPDAANPISDLTLPENAAAAIHLSGANLSGHWWTPAYKREIYASRVRTTRVLVDLLRSLKNPPRALLCASAVGIYGDRGDEVLTESFPPGQGFLADVCRAWEAEAARAAEAGIRVVHLRFGVVLAKEGGALKQMLPLFRAGLGGRLGTGCQWMSWIALNDLVRAVQHILHEESLHGPVNLVAPTPVTNRDFTAALAHALHRPAVLPVPRFALQIALGELADTALLASTRAIPERLAASGFHYETPGINAALQSIL